MTVTFYDASAGAYLQVLDAVANILEKGGAWAAEQGVDPQDIVEYRLAEDMMPFHFQIESVAHHSWGAVQGMQSGQFSPPSFAMDKNYAGLQGLVNEARDGIRSLSEEDVNALADGSLIFSLGERQLPFTNKNFLTSFSLPNFYFHATTTYDMLRIKGVTLGKMDFLGQIKVGT
ncbi:MAG: DUF1993 domain-containing protein [Pseudomonadota bacterium]